MMALIVRNLTLNAILDKTNISETQKLKRKIDSTEDMEFIEPSKKKFKTFETNTDDEQIFKQFVLCEKSINQHKKLVHIFMIFMKFWTEKTNTKIILENDFDNFIEFSFIIRYLYKGKDMNLNYSEIVDNFQNLVNDITEYNKNEKNMTKVQKEEAIKLLKHHWNEWIRDIDGGMVCGEERKNILIALASTTTPVASAIGQW